MSKYWMMKYRNAIFIIWFERSNKSFIWKWYALFINKFVFNRLKKKFQKSNVNFESRSKMMIFDIFQLINKKRFITTLIQFSTKKIVFSTMNCNWRDVLSIKINMTSLSFAFDKIKMKFMIMMWKNNDENDMKINSSYDLCRFV